jgi:hypothetical protein
MKNIRSLSVFFAVLFLFAGCLTGLKVTPKSPDKSVLYVSRGDSIFSTGQIVKIFLNGKEVTELSDDGYKALHIKPGTYDIEYKAGKPGGALETVKKFSAKIPPNTVKFCSIAYNFGAWRGPDELLEGDVLLKSGYVFEGELDLTKTVSPKK